MIKKILKKVLKKIIAFYHKNSTPIPKEEVRIFYLLKDKMNTVFDIGARTDLIFYHTKGNCSYHLFEPNHDFVLLLKKQISTFRNHDIKLNEYGLSDKREDNMIYYENSQSFIINPILKIGDDIGKRYSLRRLDDYVVENNIQKIDFLKIDAEGLDYRIMIGGINTIKNKVSFIQFEYWDGVRKFADLISDNFNLYLIIEERLLRAILKIVIHTMTPSQKKINFNKSIIKLDEAVISLIDDKLIPLGCGGNIFGIHKDMKDIDIEKLTFTI